ncbi:MAG TPA: type II secretion system protein GspM [Casimicrobiaceae bacterium]
MATTLNTSAHDRARAWWQLRTQTERIVIALLVLLVLAALLWILIWRPMQRDIERMTRTLSVDRAALIEARRRADDIATLARVPTAAPAERDARGDLDTALARAGIKAGAIDRGDGERLRTTIDSVSFDALVALLDALQRDARLRAVELTVTGRVEPGQVRAELTLAP